MISDDAKTLKKSDPSDVFASLQKLIHYVKSMLLKWTCAHWFATAHKIMKQNMSWFAVWASWLASTINKHCMAWYA